MSQNITNERSLQLEDMDEEDFNNKNNETNRPSLPKGSAVYDNDSEKLPAPATFKEVDEDDE